MEQRSFSAPKKRKRKRRLIFLALLCGFLLFFRLSGFADALSLYGGGGEESPSDLDAWNLVLVNKDHGVPFGYGKQLEFTELANGEFVDSRIYPALQQMFDAARASGVYPVVASGYRSREQQDDLVNERIDVYIGEGYMKDEARRLALTYCASPGYSEHELGSAVDINADSVYSTGNEVYSWLAQNARYYGFIRRYPEEKQSLTGIADEPWHYRYVGKEAARIIEDNGLCLEEYIEQLEKGTRRGRFLLRL